MTYIHGNMQDATPEQKKAVQRINQQHEESINRIKEENAKMIMQKEKEKMTQEQKEALQAVENFDGRAEQKPETTQKGDGAKPDKADAGKPTTRFPKMKEKKTTEGKQEKAEIAVARGDKITIPVNKPDAKAKAAEAKIQREFKKRAGIIDKHLANIECSFFVIAFQLHWIKRNVMYLTAGYKNIYEYADAQFGIGKTSCSNLICIVENYAERDEKGEIVDKIADAYKRFKQSQLVAMIGMSEEQIKGIDEKTSVRQIIQMQKDAKSAGEPEEEQDGEGGTGAGKKQESAKKIVNTLIEFNDIMKYKQELEQIDMLVERAFKKSTLPVKIKIVCEQG